MGGAVSRGVASHLAGACHTSAGCPRGGSHYYLCYTYAGTITRAAGRPSPTLAAHTAMAGHPLAGRAVGRVGGARS